MIRVLFEQCALSKHNINKLSMHNPDCVLPRDDLSNVSCTFSARLPMQIKFSGEQYELDAIRKETKLDELISAKVARKQFFYGIELIADVLKTQKSDVLDYNTFGTLMPLFTAIVWLAEDYARVNNLSDVSAIRFSKQLHERTIVLPHFCCYKVDQKRLEEFLAVNFRNVLAVRGDKVNSDQKFKHASEIVGAMREQRNDSISIGVAGYPEGHPEAASIQDDLQFLKQKVDAGANFIITQFCFSANTIIEFIQNCRAIGIVVPIVIGLYVPEDFRTLKRMLTIARVGMSNELYNQYKQVRQNDEEFCAFAVQQCIDTMTEVFKANLDVYGVQFFSMNRFHNIQKILQTIEKLNYFQN